MSYAARHNAKYVLRLVVAATTAKQRQHTHVHVRTHGYVTCCSYVMMTTNTSLQHTSTVPISKLLMPAAEQRVIADNVCMYMLHTHLQSA